MQNRENENEGGRQILVQLGNLIKRIRHDRDISQAELARLCGFTKAGLSRIESGKVNITMRTLLCISEGLSVSVAQLLAVLD
jgi:transcriptional regulator with XRE-family HTH domain